MGEPYDHQALTENVEDVQTPLCPSEPDDMLPKQRSEDLEAELGSDNEQRDDNEPIVNGQQHIPKSISFGTLQIDFKDDSVSPYPQNRRPYTRLEQWKYRKSPVIISVGFLCIYSAFYGIQNLASTIYRDSGLGFISFCLVYLTSLFSTFLSPFFVKNLTPKWTLVISFAVHGVFVVSNLFPRFYTLLPSAILLGMVIGPMWTSAIMYVNTGGLELAIAGGKEPSHVVSNFNSLFIAIQKSSQIIGNLLASFVLQARNQRTDADDTCGASFCPSVTHPLLQPLQQLPAVINVSVQLLHPQKHVYNIVTTLQTPLVTEKTEEGMNNVYILVLCGIYLLIVMFATVLTAVTLGPYKVSRAVSGGYGTLTDNLDSKTLFMYSTELWAKLNMILLLPLSYVSGMQLGYLFIDFTEAFVACEIGIAWIGYTMTFYGIFSLLFTYLAPKMHKYIGRPILLSIAYVLTMIVFIIMAAWAPDRRSVAVFFIIPILWGISDAIFQSETYAFIGLLFPEHQQPTFASHRVFHMLGLAITFGYSTALCLGVKIALGMILMTAAMVCYGIVENRYRRIVKTVSTIT